MTYLTAHDRLRRLLGKASDYGCTFCDRQAYQWAYDGKDINEQWGLSAGRSLLYSNDRFHYLPLCVPCHKRFDNGSIVENPNTKRIKNNA